MTPRFGHKATIIETSDETKELRIEEIENIADGAVKSHFRRVSLRIKVSNKKDETAQYLQFSDLIEQKRNEGALIVRDADPATKPSFVIEYPRSNSDGGYFVVRTHTELMI